VTVSVTLTVSVPLGARASGPLSRSVRPPTAGPVSVSVPVTVPVPVTVTVPVTVPVPVSVTVPVTVSVTVTVTEPGCAGLWPAPRERGPNARYQVPLFVAISR